MDEPSSHRPPLGPLQRLEPGIELDVVKILQEQQIPRVTQSLRADSYSVREPGQLELLPHSGPVRVRPSNLQRKRLLSHLRLHNYADSADAQDSQAAYLRPSLEDQKLDSEPVELGESAPCGAQRNLRVGEDSDVRRSNEPTNRNSFRGNLRQYRPAPPRAIPSSLPPFEGFDPRRLFHSSQSPCLSWGNRPSW